MIQRAQAAADYGRRLSAVEVLLERALEDLAAGSREAPAAVCAAALGEVAVELRTLVGMLAKQGPAAGDRVNLLARLSALPGKLQRLEQLLATAGEFYRGWCAAAPAAVLGYEAPGYEATGWPQAPGPALVALEC